MMEPTIPLSQESQRTLRKAAYLVSVAALLLGTLLTFWTSGPYSLYPDFRSANLAVYWPAGLAMSVVISGVWLLVVSNAVLMKADEGLQAISRRIRVINTWLAIIIGGSAFFLLVQTMGFIGMLPSFALIGMWISFPMITFPFWGFAVVRAIAFRAESA